MTSSPPQPHMTEGPAAVPRESIDAMLPQDMLHEDEIVLILAKPSLWFIPFTSLRFMLVVTALGALAVQPMLQEAINLTRQNIAIIATLICLGRLVWGLLVWTSHIYLLTNQRIVTIKGVLNVVIFQCNLRKIQRTTLYKPLVLRFFGLGTIGLATAATTNFDSFWEMVPRPVATHEQIVAAIQRVQ